MQELCWCEVIGCEEPASWSLVCREDSSSEEFIGGEDFLCSAHWETLNRRDPRHATCYEHLSGRLAEGKDPGSIVSTATPKRGDVSASSPETWKQKRNYAHYNQDRWRDLSGNTIPIPIEHLGR